jgi:hypothetical protein
MAECVGYDLGVVGCDAYDLMMMRCVPLQRCWYNGDYTLRLPIFCRYGRRVCGRGGELWGDEFRDDGLAHSLRNTH